MYIGPMVDNLVMLSDPLPIPLCFYVRKKNVLTYDTRHDFEHIAHPEATKGGSIAVGRVNKFSGNLNKAFHTY